MHKFLSEGPVVCNSLLLRNLTARKWPRQERSVSSLDVL